MVKNHFESKLDLVQVGKLLIPTTTHTHFSFSYNFIYFSTSFLPNLNLEIVCEMDFDKVWELEVGLKNFFCKNLVLALKQLHFCFFLHLLPFGFSIFTKFHFDFVIFYFQFFRLFCSYCWKDFGIFWNQVNFHFTINPWIYFVFKSF